MKNFRALFLVALFAVALLPCTGRAGAGEGASARWRVTPSFKYDALCFLNVLTGDPFYRRFYEKEYALFAPRLTRPARTALDALRRRLKDENGNVVPAFLSLYFSADDGETLEEMLGALGRGRLMRERLKRSAYYSEGGWRLFERVRGDVRAGLLFLKEAGFEDYWRRSVLPGVAARAAAFAEGLSRHDVIGEVEGRLGFGLPSNIVDVYVLNFARPHGIRLTGARLVTDASYPLEVFLRLTVHELLHPPFRLARDGELKQALDALRADAFLMEMVARHNPSFGYNLFESFVEEDCVRALEQVISERLGFAADARRRWAEEDEGVHVLAVALYELMRREGYGGRREVFGDFLLRSLRTGSLAPGKIKALHDSFYGSKTHGPRLGPARRHRPTEAQIPVR